MTPLHVEIFSLKKSPKKLSKTFLSSYYSHQFSQAHYPSIHLHYIYTASPNRLLYLDTAGLTPLRVESKFYKVILFSLYNNIKTIVIFQQILYNLDIFIVQSKGLFAYPLREIILLI